MIVQDADLEYDPRDYHKLLGPILEDRADAVFGSRFAGGETHRVLFFWHYVGNRFLTLLSNMFTNPEPHRHGDLLQDDPHRRAPARHAAGKPFRLRARGDGEAGAPAGTDLRSRHQLRGRTYEEGKKIGWKDGVRAIWCIVKYGLLGLD